MQPVELRSDTFTTPTAEMRRAMADAEVGDDAWGEDPTANALEDHCADRFGVEAALFMPTGTMANEASLNVLTRPGDELIVDARAHVVLFEQGGPAALSGVVIRALDSEAGALDPAAVEAICRGALPHTSRPTVVWIENTHNARGGRVVPLATIQALADVARTHGAQVFLDGARLFNASVASGTPVADYAAAVDALTICFSKGLGAPVGSMALGSQAFIDELRVVRQRFGGSMRQVGVLCAAARVALDTGVERLAADHERARRLAAGWAEAAPDAIDLDAVETNMVFAAVGDRSALALAAAMAEDGVRVGAIGPHTLRAVTHHQVDDAGIDRAIAAFARAVRTAGPTRRATAPGAPG